MKIRSLGRTGVWLAPLFLAIFGLVGCDGSAAPDVSGPGVVEGPASLQLSQASVDFGQVPVTNEATYTISVVNAGAEYAELTGFDIEEGSIVSFVSLDKDPLILAPGESRDFSFKFMPSSVAVFSAVAKIHTQNGKQTWKVDLTGEATPCFYLDQSAINFLETTPACGVKIQKNKLSNKCNYPIQVNTVGVSSASTQAVFEVTPELRGGTIEPGSEVELTVRFDPSILGDFRESWTLRTQPLQVGGVFETLHFDLSAKSSVSITQTDSFTVAPQPGTKVPLDILIVLDSVQTPMSTLFGLQIQELVSQLVNDGYDLRIGFLAPYQPGYQCQLGSTKVGGALWPTDNSSPRILTPLIPNFSELLYSRLTSRDNCTNYGGGSQVGLEAVSYALSPNGAAGMDQFVRTHAKLILMFFSYYNDQGWDSPEAHAAQYRLAKSGPDLITALSATRFDSYSYYDGERYRQAVTALGGLNQSLGQVDIGAFKAHITQNTLLSASGTRVQLTRPPIASSITVLINGAIDSSWTYDAITNSVVFPTSYSAGSSIQVMYNVGCI